MADKNVELKLKAQRLSFVNVFEPQKFTDSKTGKIRWTRNLNVLVPKTINDKGEYDPKGVENPLVKLIADGMRQAMVNQWGDNAPKIPAERRCFRDGEPKDPDTNEREALYDGYAGHYFLAANKSLTTLTDGGYDPEENQIIVLDSRKGPDGKFPRLTARDGKLYSGCVADVIVRIYGFDGKKLDVPSRINASLEAIKFVRHGAAFGAKPIDAQNAFDEEEPEDDDMDDGKKPAAASDEDDDLLG